ncbi:MAG: DUF3619 family protein [Bdellovibrio sp.]|nr:DUF3619 family protein [Methylotenera sp.]
MSTNDLPDHQIDNEAGAQNIDVQAKQISGLLDVHANHLSMRTLKQLENGRERAVKAHAAQVSGLSVNRDGTFSGLSAWADHHRLVTAGIVLAAILAGFIGMQSLKHQESSDAFLLSADLPPEAFVDRGFEPSLNSSHVKL